MSCLLIFSPNFPGQVLVAATMEVGHSFFDKIGCLGIVVDVCGLVERNAIQITDTDDDSGTLGTSSFLPFVVPIGAAVLAGTGGAAAAATIVDVGIAVDTSYIAGADDALLL